VRSGTLIVYKGEATTADPATGDQTTENGNVPCDSTKENDNNVFRLLTKDSFGPDISVSVDYTPLKDTNPKGENDSYDGFTIWVGNQPNKDNEDYGLYTVSIRSGGEVVIKRKVPEANLSPNEISRLRKTDDFANGGGYYVLGDYLQVPDLATMGTPRHVVVNLQKLPNGDAKITLIVDGKTIMSVTDNGQHGKPYLSGQVGLRLDNTKATFDNLEVEQLPPVSPSGSPETPSPSQQVSALGQLSIGRRSIPQLSPFPGNPAALPAIGQRPLGSAA
jgi:hypothetical protein